MYVKKEVNVLVKTVSTLALLISHRDLQLKNCSLNATSPILELAKINN